MAPDDYHGRDEAGVPRLSVTKAMKTLSWQGKPGHTKNRQNRTLPIPEDVADAIEALWPAERRLSADRYSPMVWNPRTGRRWSHWALRQSWLKACRTAGVPSIPLYEGTKHSAATDMLARTKDLEAVRKYLGHRDPRSTEKYARVVDAALIDIAKRGPR